MRKQFLYVLAAITIFFALSCGCNKAAGADPDPVTPPAEEEQKQDSTEVETPDFYADFLLPAAEDSIHAVLAFPGAEGGGMYTTGGRGGKILHVTNLNDSGTGSLRQALCKTSGARTIVFDVAGTIALESPLKINYGDVTVAGQTAPGDGICIKNYTTQICADNVIIRFLRFRMGDEKATEDDALNCYTKSSYKNIIIDHCSLSWSTDECGSFYGTIDFTLQYCILSESLRNSVHDKGKHGYGGIWGGSNASFHHNLLAHHDSRNPRFDHDYVNSLKGPVHHINNVVYNWGSNSAYGGESGSGQEAKKINMVANYYKSGPATSAKSRILNITTKCSYCNSTNQNDVVPGMFYISENHVDGFPAVSSDNWSGVIPDSANKIDVSTRKSGSYQGSHTGTVHSAQKAFEAVLKYAGASLRRDSVDERIEREVREGKYTFEGSKGSTGGLIDTQSDAGGWPKLSATADELSLVKDTDRDGMPDWFEDQMGLNSSDTSDAAAKTLDLKGRYTNLEMYLHYIIKDNFKY